jgi:hypothetical protein
MVRVRFGMLLGARLFTNMTKTAMKITKTIVPSRNAHQYFSVIVLTSEKELSIIYVNTVRQKEVLMCDECEVTWFKISMHGCS